MIGVDEILTDVHKSSHHSTPTRQSTETTRKCTQMSLLVELCHFCKSANLSQDAFSRGPHLPSKAYFEPAHYLYLSKVFWASLTCILFSYTIWVGKQEKYAKKAPHTQQDNTCIFSSTLIFVSIKWPPMDHAWHVTTSTLLKYIVWHSNYQVASKDSTICCKMTSNRVHNTQISHWDFFGLVNIWKSQNGM